MRGLYNFSNDKLEQTPLLDSARQMDLTEKLESAYQSSLSLQSLYSADVLKKYKSADQPKDAPEADGAPVSSEVLKQLKSLGYIGK